MNSKQRFLLFVGGVSGITAAISALPMLEVLSGVSPKENLSGSAFPGMFLSMAVSGSHSHFSIWLALLLNWIAHAIAFLLSLKLLKVAGGH